MVRSSPTAPTCPSPSPPAFCTWAAGSTLDGPCPGPVEQLTTAAAAPTNVMPTTSPAESSRIFGDASIQEAGHTVESACARDIGELGAWTLRLSERSLRFSVEAGLELLRRERDAAEHLAERSRREHRRYRSGRRARVLLHEQHERVRVAVDVAARDHERHRQPSDAHGHERQRQ